MFYDIIQALREAAGAFDMSDTPEEPVIRPKGKPPAPPLKAFRGYKPPVGYKPPAKKAKLPGMPMEAYDKPKIINKLNNMDGNKKDVIKNIKQKADMARSGVDVTKESTKFGPVISEMRSLLEKMGKMAKSGVPKVDRQDAMARHVGVKINLPTDLTGARKIMQMRQKPDPLPTPQPLPHSTRKKITHLTDLVKKAVR
jgi:hypothetical protein